jgi:hypothetical protein
VPPAEQEIREQILEGKESRRHMKAFWIGSVRPIAFDSCHSIDRSLSVSLLTSC